MRRIYVFGAGSLIAFAASVQAAAQVPAQGQRKTVVADRKQAPAAKPAEKKASAAAAASGGLQEITVTAQRRKQNLQDVPIAISNFSAKDIAQRQINATADIPRLVPNMFTNNVVGTGSGNVYYLRGLGQTESFSHVRPASRDLRR